jgi:protocatechuate 3,4-dioxygenase alpha subunit
VDAILVAGLPSHYRSVEPTASTGVIVETGTAQLPTPSQTVGPFFAVALPWPDGPFVVDRRREGAFWIRGTVTDGAGEPIPDALVETWQADGDGRFPGSPDAPFRGFGRCPTDAAGTYGIWTVKPGAVPGVGGAAQAAHIDVAVFMRGLLRPVITRIYFPDDPATTTDPLLASIPAGARATMIASRSDDGYRFDIRLQGEGETAFFDL